MNTKVKLTTLGILISASFYTVWADYTPKQLGALNKKIMEATGKGKKQFLIFKKKNEFLLAAAQSGYYSLVNYLLEFGADIGTTNELGKTALHLATENNHINVVEVLLRHKRLSREKIINLMGAKDKKGNTVFHYAAKSGHTEVVKKIFAAIKELGIKGEDAYKLLAQKDDGGNTVFHYAAKSGHTEVVKEIFAAIKELGIKGEDAYKLLAQKDDEGNTVFHSAVKGRHTEVVKEIFAAMKRLKIKDIVYEDRIILKGRAKGTLDSNLLTQEDNKGHTVFYYTNKKGGTVFVKEFCNFIMQDKYAFREFCEYTIFWKPIKATKEIFAAIEQCGMQRQDILNFITYQDVAGYTVLHYAVHQSVWVDESMWTVKKIFSIIEQCGMQRQDILNFITHQDNAGQTVRHYTAQGGCTNIAREILAIIKKYGMQSQNVFNFITHQDNEGKTILHYAADREYLNIIKEIFAIIEKLGIPRQDVLNFITQRDKRGKPATRYAQHFYSLKTDVYFFLLNYFRRLRKLEREDHIKNGSILSTRGSKAEAENKLLTTNDDEITQIEDASRINNDKLTTTDTIYSTVKAGNIDSIKAILTKLQKEEVIKLINGKDNQGKTPLYYAIQKGHIELVKLLLNQGATPNIKTVNDAIKAKQPEIALALLEVKTNDQKFWNCQQKINYPLAKMLACWYARKAYESRKILDVYKDTKIKAKEVLNNFEAYLKNNPDIIPENYVEQINRALSFETESTFSHKEKDKAFDNDSKTKSNTVINNTTANMEDTSTFGNDNNEQDYFNPTDAFGGF